MSGNTMEFAALRSEGEMRAWLADNGCPETIARKVVEKRMTTPGFKPAQADDKGAIQDKVRAAAIL